MIGTQATVASGAYDRAVAATGAPVTLRSQACPVFVEHVERGDTTSDELRTAARGYLSPLMADGIDTLIMGCTHYPLLSGLLQLELGPDVVLVSSAEETAKDVYATLVADRLLRAADDRAAHAFLATGDPDGVRACGRGVPRAGARRGGRRARRARRGWHVELTVLGSAGTWPGPGGATCGHLLSHEGTHIWLDAGTGTFARLQEYIDIDEIAAIVDHARPYRSLHRRRAGLLRAPLRRHGRAEPSLLLARRVRRGHEPAHERERPQRHGRGLRLPHGGGGRRVRRWTDARDHVRDDPHRRERASGYRIEAGGAVLAYTGDSGPCEEVIEMSRDADLLVAEATYQDASSQAFFHMSATQAAQHATQARARSD